MSKRIESSIQIFSNDNQKTYQKYQDFELYIRFP